MKKALKHILILLIVFGPLWLSAQQNSSINYSLELPEYLIQGVEYELKIHSEYLINEEVSYEINDEKTGRLQFNEKGEAMLSHSFGEEQEFKLNIRGQVKSKAINAIPIWWSLLPPLLAIFLALIIREVISSLLIGIFAGAVVIALYSQGLIGWLYAFMRLIDTYLLGALNNEGHLSIIVFSLLIGGMVSVVSKNGGMQGVVNRISKYAHSAQSGQLATWFLGVAIFFDDYANTLIVGNTMRPITDKLRISREKLAYLVDSTAAPMAAIAFVTTWIGAELGYIASGVENINGLDEGVYSIFISSLAYSFYPILALAFMLILIWKQKDYGPMYSAEKRAREKGVDSFVSSDEPLSDDFRIKDGVEAKAYHAIIPVLVVVLGTLLGLFYTGWDAAVWADDSLGLGRKLSSTIGNADSYLALLWSSAAGLITAIKLSVFKRTLSLSESIEAATQGLKTMLPAIVILILAWALAGVIDDLHTADFLTSILSDQISPYLVPTVTFILAALVAFSTGSSWGTMAILYPLMLPVSWTICEQSGLDYESTLSIFHNTVSCVLAGAVLGDHCSPISDTTILSSLASSCNHIQHVRTQMPYALTVGFVAVLFGTLPASFGLPFWLSLIIALSILYLIVQLKGKKV